MTDQLRSERPTDPEDAPKSGLKLVIELGPLLVFVVVYAMYGIYAATGALMVGSVLSVIASKLLLGHVGVMPIITAVLVCFFGGLTFLLDDPRFIKMKPTMVNLLFAGVLGFGLMTGRLFIKMMLGEAMHLTPLGWRKLTIRWIAFFVFVAALNEVVWRNMSESAWVNFKAFGLLPLTLCFAAAQIGLIKSHGAKPEFEQNV